MDNRWVFRRVAALMAGCALLGGIIGWFSYEFDPEV